MSNLVTVNSGSAIDGTLKAGRIAIATSASIDPTGFYNMINPAGGYVFITDPKVQGYNDGPPQIYQSPTNLPADILATINGLPDRVESIPFDNVWDALVWVQSTGKYFILDKTLNGVHSGEISMYMSPDSLASYPQSGSTVYNLGGTTDGTLANGPVWSYDGYFDFDGTDDYLTLGSSAASLVQGKTAVTMGILFKLDATASLRGLIGTLNYNCGKNLGLVASGTTLSFYNDYSSTCYSVNAPTAISTGKWIFAVGTYDGTTTRIYMIQDGTMSQNSGTSKSGATNTFASDFRVMGNQYPNYFTNGQCAQAFVYDRALSEDEIWDLYFKSNIVKDNLVFAFDPGNLVSYDKEGITLYSLTGSFSGNITNWSSDDYHPEFGGYIDTDGSDDYLTTTLTGVNLDSGCTIEGWVKRNSLPAAWRTYFNIKSNSSNIPFFEFRQSAANNNVLPLYYNGINYAPTAYDAEFNEFYHFVGVYDGAGNILFYVNGEYVSTKTGVPSFALGNDPRLTIGRAYDNSRYTDIGFGPIRVYDTPLSADQINQNYRAEYSRFKSSRDITKDGLGLQISPSNPNSYLSGTTISDLSGNGRDGTLVNNPTFLVENGGIIEFDGTDDYIDFGSLAGTFISDPASNGGVISFSIWVYAIGGYYIMSSGAQTSSRGIAISYQNGSPFISIRTGAKQQSYSPGANFPTGQWIHWVAVSDNTNWVVYKDGVQISSQALGSDIVADNQTKLTIGVPNNVLTNYQFEGKVGDVAFWDTALTAQDVSNLYTSQAPKYKVSLPRTVTDSLKLNLDAGDITSYPRTGTTWYDRSGQGNNGTLTNGALYVFDKGGKITLDGTNDYVLTTWKAPAGNKSMNFWVKYNSLDAAGGNGYSLTGAQQVNAYFYTGIIDGGQGYSYAGNTGGTYNYYFNASEWYNIATVMDNGVTRHYVNGEQVATRNYTTSNASTVNFPIGCVHNGSVYQHFFDADFANMRVYDRVLTPSEVLENYKATRSRFGVDGIVTSNLSVLYDFSNVDCFDNSSTTVTDLQGLQNGTLVNGMPFRSNNGGVVAFDGSNDYVDAGSLVFPDYTILMWFKIDTTQTTFSTVGHRTFVGCSNFRFQWDDNNTVLGRGPFIDFTSGGGSTGTGNTFSPKEWFNKWHQVGFSRTNGTVKMYWNGVNTQTGAIAGQDLSDFEIGYDRLSGIGGADPINRDGGEVQLGHFMIYNDVLTDAEVLQNYNALKNRFGKD